MFILISFTAGGPTWGKVRTTPYGPIGKNHTARGCVRGGTGCSGHDGSARGGLRERGGAVAAVCASRGRHVAGRSNVGGVRAGSLPKRGGTGGTGRNTGRIYRDSTPAVEAGGVVRGYGAVPGATGRVL